MKNFVMFWNLQTDETGDLKLNAVHDNNNLKQIYHIPAGYRIKGKGPEFEVLEDSDPERNVLEMNDGIKDGTDWKLIVFCLHNISPLDDRLRDLRQLLSEMMYYDPERSAGQQLSPFTAGRNGCLHCEPPQQIWIITLKDKFSEQFRPRTETKCSCVNRADELPYSIYPPNCRFLQYDIDYRNESGFVRSLFQLHCAVRTLAESRLASDELKGNCSYRVSVLLDNDKLCSELEDYRRWMTSIRSALNDMRFREETVFLVQEINSGYQPDYEDIRGFKHRWRTVEKYRIFTEQQIRQENEDERVCLYRSKKSIDRELNRYDGAVLTETDRVKVEEEKNSTEIEMLRIERPSIQGFLKFVIKLRRWLMFGDCDFPEDIDINTELEYFLRMKGIMAKVKPTRLIFSIIIFHILFFQGGMQPSEFVAPSIDVQIATPIIEAVLCLAAYKVIKQIYSSAHKMAGEYFKKICESEIESSRDYYRNLVSYLRMLMILRHDENGRRENSKYSEWLRSRQKELDAFWELCEKLRMMGLPESSHVFMDSGKRGNPRQLLRQERADELYALSRRRNRIRLNGTGQICDAPFSFISEVNLKRLY